MHHEAQFQNWWNDQSQKIVKTVNNCKRMLAAQWKRQDAEHTFKDTMSKYFRALNFWTANIPLRSYSKPNLQFCEFAHNGNSRRSVWLSAVQDNAQFDSVLSRTMLSLTQRCPGQYSVWLSAVQDNAQFDSVLSRTAPSDLTCKSFQNPFCLGQTELIYSNCWS